MSELIEAAKAGDAARARHSGGISRGRFGAERGRRNTADGGPLPRTSRSSRRDRRRHRQVGCAARRLRGSGARPRRCSTPRSNNPGAVNSASHDGWTPRTSRHSSAAVKRPSGCSPRRRHAEREVDQFDPRRFTRRSALAARTRRCRCCSSSAALRMCAVDRPCHCTLRRRERRRGGGGGAPDARRRCARRGCRGQDAAFSRRRPQSRDDRRLDQLDIF